MASSGIARAFLPIFRPSDGRSDRGNQFRRGCRRDQARNIDICPVRCRQAVSNRSTSCPLRSASPRTRSHSPRNKHTTFLTGVGSAVALTTFLLGGLTSNQSSPPFSLLNSPSVPPAQSVEGVIRVNRYEARVERIRQSAIDRFPGFAAVRALKHALEKGEAVYAPARMARVHCRRCSIRWNAD